MQDATQPAPPPPKQPPRDTATGAAGATEARPLAPATYQPARPTPGTPCFRNATTYRNLQGAALPPPPIGPPTPHFAGHRPIGPLSNTRSIRSRAPFRCDPCSQPLPRPPQQPLTRYNLPSPPNQPHQLQLSPDGTRRLRGPRWGPRQNRVPVHRPSPGIPPRRPTRPPAPPFALGAVTPTTPLDARRRSTHGHVAR